MHIRIPSPRNLLSSFNLSQKSRDRELRMMMIGGGGGDGNGEGGGTRDHQQQEVEAFMKEFPIGYRFKPTDKELIKYYLYRKVNKLRLPRNLIVDINIYSYSPWDLTDRYRSYGDETFYFFTPRERRYQNGKRPNRAASGGYWKASGADTPIIDEKTNEKIGYKRLLVFYLGKPPKADPKKQEILRKTKTDWLMHEYTLKKLKEEEKKKKDKHCTDAGSPNNKQLDEFVLCKLYLKRGKSTKDMKYPDPPPSIATTTSSSAAAAAAAAATMPENHHQMHQTAVVDHQYSFTSMVAAAAAKEMVPENYHYMCQTAVAAAADHQNPLTSMVEAAVPEEMMPVNQYQHLMHQTDAAAINHQCPLTSMVATAVPEEMMPLNDSYNGPDNINPSSVAASSAILPSVNHHHHGEMTQQQLQDEFEWEMLLADLTNTDSQPNLLAPAGFSSLPAVRTDIGPR